PLRTMRRPAEARPSRRGRTLRGRVVWIDHFGNLITNVGRDDVGALARAFRTRRLSVTIAERAVRLRRSYAGVPPGAALAILNSADALEIAVNRGSAAAVFGCERGAPVTVIAR